MIIWKKREGGGDDNYVGEAFLSASCGIPGNAHGLVADGSYLIDRIMGSFCVVYQPPAGVPIWITGRRRDQPESIQTLGGARVLAHEHHQIRALAREKALRAQYKEGKAKRQRSPRADDDDYAPG
jgi:hypothetical protein